MFRHLFGVSEDEVRTWPLHRWQRYRNYARTQLHNQVGGD